jgi:hypothetical protein
MYDDDKEFEERLAHFINDVRNNIIENNKAINHAIDNWNRAKYDPVASIRSGDKLAKLLSKFLKEL